jgi:hypothetical protein
VHINRLGVNSIEFETDLVEIPLSPGGEYSCEMVIINYGSPTNVHLSVSDSLKENITFLEDNPYVRHEEYVPVVVRIPPDGRLFNSGEIFITVGYGSRTEGFEVDVGSQGLEPAFDVDVEDEISVPSRSNVHGRRTGRFSGELSSMTSHLIGGISETIKPRSAILIVSMFAFLLLIYAISGMIPEDFKISLGFYPAVLLAILFTALMLYLLTKSLSFK